MKQPYTDIIEAVGREPQWWDEVGVPRFCEFHPMHLNNPYACEGVLLLIACQSCSKEYHVALSYHHLDVSNIEATKALLAADEAEKEPPPQALPAMPLTRRLKAGYEISYGDPPFACGDNCSAGYSMLSYTLRVEQVWLRSDEWTRIPKLEKDYPSLEEQRASCD